MKKRTKLLAAVLSCVAIAGASVFGTMAYLNDSDTVTNTFTVGKVDISLDEAKTNTAGEKLANDGTVYTNDSQTLADRVKANTYHLLPGHTYVKDPVVHVEEGSEASYLFIKVNNGLKGAESATNNGGYTAIADQITANGWTPMNYTGVDAEANVTVYYQKAEATTTASKDYATFSQFKVIETMTNASLAVFSDDKIEVTAYAIQQEGLTVDAAAGALGLSGWTTQS